MKLTWVHGTGQTDANDPAPTSVMLIESSSASWTAQVYNSQAVYAAGTGQADDGIKDSEVDHSAYGAEQGGISTSANNASTSVPPPHWTSYAVSNGVLTLPQRTLIAEASVTSPAGGGATDFACSVGTYTIQIHPQPYSWHQTNEVDNQNGTLSFTYGWLSTTGDITNLTTCFEHERVTYPGGSPYAPPLPFDQSINYVNPTVLPGTGSNGIEMNETDTNLDTQQVFATTKPYSAVTITATQRYEYDDTATHQQNVLVPGPDSTASITRQIYSVGTPPNWFYSVTKNGSTAKKALQ